MDGNAASVENLVATLWEYSLGSVVNLLLLQRNADELAEEMEKLQALKEDLKRNQLRGPPGATPREAEFESQMRGWMNSVDGAAKDAAYFQRSFDSRCFCATGFWLGFNAAALLIRLRALSLEGNRLFRAQVRLLERRPEAVELVSSDTPSSGLVGLEEPLSQIKGYIQRNDVGIVGICGTAGVGKTALLKIVNNEFLTGEDCKDRFDVAIWVTVSPEAGGISSIQETIKRRLRLRADISAAGIYRELSGKRFIMLFDGVREKLDLVEVGIPLPGVLRNASKVLFTTRSEEVCREMCADTVMNLGQLKLDAERSWKLFRWQFRGATPVLEHPVIQRLAETVVARCSGLPIFLVELGRELSNAKTIYDWRDVIYSLDDRIEVLSQQGSEGNSQSTKEKLMLGAGEDQNVSFSTSSSRQQVSEFVQLYTSDLISSTSSNDNDAVELQDMDGRLIDGGDSYRDPYARTLPNAIADRVENLVAALWDYSLGLLVSPILLCRHAEQLEENMQRLGALKADLNSQAKHEIRRNLPAEMAHELSRWLGSVDALALKASDFERSFGDRSWCSITSGHTAVQLLKEVKKLTQAGEALQSGGLLINQLGPDAVQLLSDRGQLCQQPEPRPVQPVPSEIARATNLVGTANPLQQIKDYIKDEGIGIIGIYGMGGVGKTTLLKVINNDFLMGSEGTSMFDVAIWVTVSREARNILDIQKTIANRLGLPSPVDKDTLFRELLKRRFVLLLDDVWERLDLVGELGVPLPKDSKNNSKILFTTRSEEVCCQMDADVLMKVGCLDEDSSWELFRSKLGKKDGQYHLLDDDHVIKPLAKQVVKKCGGLPITLITMGRAMAACAKTADDWRDAITKLDHRPADLAPGMENDVLQRLRFSFDMLRSKTLQDCLLYLALFPEDHYIRQEEIIDYWICEGFHDSEEFDEPDIDVTRQSARILITNLQNACLLEVDDKWPQRVRLHDAVRDMALWITKNEYVVLAGFNCIASRVPKLAIWQKATRISLINNRQIDEPPSSCWNLNCPNLTTLLLQTSRFAENIPRDGGFLTYLNMPALRVLNLSRASLKELPIGITSLISLQFLSLQGNDLTSLPVELGNLVNLRQLNLSDNKNLEPIPREALSRLSSLQVLDMSCCQEPDGSDAFLQRSELEDLGTLKSLHELHLRGDGVCSWILFQVIADSPALRRSIRGLQLCFSLQPPPTGETISQRILGLGRISILEVRADSNNPVTGELMLYSVRLQHLEVLRIRYFIEAKISIIRWGEAPLFPGLASLQIEGCGCYELTWIGRIPCLEELEVENCEKLREILLSDGNNDEDIDDQTIPPSSLFFPKLRRMSLRNLPSLRSISRHTLLLSLLEELELDECPQLRRLPLRLPSLKAFNVFGCPELRRLPLERDRDSSVSDTDIICGSKACRGCSDLTWSGRFSCLWYLDIQNCEGLTEIDGNDDDDVDEQTIPPSLFFSELQSMLLFNLPSLRSISTGALLSLESLYVTECPRLRRLPLFLPSLERLHVDGCPELSELRLRRDRDSSARDIGGSKICRDCSDLTWTGGLPCLKELEVKNCEKLTEILTDGSNDEGIDDQTVPRSSLFFPKLWWMSLENLPSLRSISTRSLLLPCLGHLDVRECPELRRLSLGRDSAPNISKIKGSETWWDGLEWEEITIQERFRSKFEDSGRSSG